jgi:hypothetical protein
LRARLGEIHAPPAARTAAALTTFVADQSQSACGQERLLGSTEVLESLFGKLKRLEGQQNQSGFTKLVLGLAASVATLTQDYLCKALTEIQTKHISQWCEQHLGIFRSSPTPSRVGMFRRNKTRINTGPRPMG